MLDRLLKQFRYSSSIEPVIETTAWPHWISGQMLRSHSVVSSSRTVRPCSPWEGRWIGHWRTTWSTVCSSAPQRRPYPICTSRSGNVQHRCGDGYAGPMLFLGGVVRLHSMGGYALSGANVQAPWHGVPEQCSL